MSSVQTEEAVKVRPGNLVRPWSRVTWQVHVGIHLTKNLLSEAMRVNERKWDERVCVCLFVYVCVCVCVCVFRGRGRVHMRKSECERNRVCVCVGLCMCVHSSANGILLHYCLHYSVTE